MYILHIKFISYCEEEICSTTPREQLNMYMFNFHYRNRENSKARSCAPRDVEWSRQQGGSKTVSNRRCNHPTPSAQNAHEHMPPLPLPLSLSFSLVAVSGNTENLPRDKTKPGPAPLRFHPPIYAVAASGSSAPSGPNRLSRRTFSLTESTVRPTSSQLLASPPLRIRQFPTTTWSRHPPVSTTKRPGLRAS